MREALFECFIDVRSPVKAGLPRKMFKTQCKVFFEQWLEKGIVFLNSWTPNWIKEYGVSLRHPNKRFQINQADREEKIFE